jgi:hypothetical protein
MIRSVYEVRFPADFSTEVINRKAKHGLISKAAANCAAMLYHGERSTVRPMFFSGKPDRAMQITQEIVNIGWIREVTS